MDGVIIVVQPLGGGWQATVWEGCFIMYEEAHFTSFASAMAAASAWVRLHLPGVRYLTEIRSAADGGGS